MDPSAQHESEAPPAAWSAARLALERSETGMLARAERFPDFRGLQAAAVFAEDEVLLDAGRGEVVHRYDPTRRKGRLVGAWARVVREGRLPVVVWLEPRGCVQPSPLWQHLPAAMMERCARGVALRAAYPGAFGALAGPGPLRPGDDEALVAAARAGSHTQVVAFGSARGGRIAALTPAQLEASIELAQRRLATSPGARWSQAMQESLVALEVEAARRAEAPPGQRAR